MLLKPSGPSALRRSRAPVSQVYQLKQAAGYRNVAGRLGRSTTGGDKGALTRSKEMEQMNTQGALVFTLVPVIGVLLTALLALHYTKDPVLRTAANVALSLTGVLIIGLTLSVGGIVFGTHLLSWVL